MKRVLFLLFTWSLAALFAVAIWRDTDREWTRTQRRFFKTLAKGERRGLSPGIKQLIISDLDRVDRCTTCHLAVDKPQLALAEEPFTAHPGQILQSHPPEKFGCTVCHGGQGLATEAEAAHGDVKHWEEPLLRGPLVQASCARCHGDVQAIAAHAPLAIEGEALFRAKGCYGCHAVRDFGQTVSQDLTAIGSKSYLLMEADFEMMDPPHDRIQWLTSKLRHPRRLNPGVRPEHLPPGEEEVFPSAMPRFGLADDEVRALAVYLLSLTEFNPPVSYTTPAAPPAPAPVYSSAEARGQAVFERFGCAGCHGSGGLGGRHNWNGGLGQEIPSLLHVKAYYGQDIESLKELIRRGRQPVPRADPARPRTLLYMPAWADRIAEEDLDALVAYLLSLSDRLPQAASE
ncbi:MAG: c-type cytochrome [Candidatus Omnitrophica bacterium]|nr:c-type cytochrome [Candidatus Omnitrophota bacterium]